MLSVKLGNVTKDWRRRLWLRLFAAKDLRLALQRALQKALQECPCVCKQGFGRFEARSSASNDRFLVSGPPHGPARRRGRAVRVDASATARRERDAESPRQSRHFSAPVRRPAGPRDV